MSDDSLTRFFGTEGDLCPICLDPMPVVTFRATERCTMTCCGNYMCTKCDGDMVKHEEEMLKKHYFANPTDDMEQIIASMKQKMVCPLCRCTNLGTLEEEFQQVLANAKKGHAWAQLSAAMKYEEGSVVEKDLFQAAYWYRKAAEQGHPWAQSNYGLCLELGNGVDQSVLEAKKWYEKAASVGTPQGQANLAALLLEGEHGIAKDEKEAIRLLQLAADQGYDRAECSLGECYRDATGVSKDYEKAIYWYEKAAEQGNITAMARLTITLMDIAMEKYGSMEITGKCPIPRAIKWARKAVAMGDQKGVGLVTSMEEGQSSDCANCGKPKPANSDLLRCSRCKIMYYCGRECQMKHWKAGHKKDCCEQD